MIMMNPRKTSLLLWICLLSCSLHVFAFIVPVDRIAPFQVQQKKWSYRGFDVAYAISGSPVHGMLGLSDATPVVILNGFGVGYFHQDRLLPHLNDGSRKVYCMDYIGQGNSWPAAGRARTGAEDDDAILPSATASSYSADTWTDQVIDFIDQVVKPSSGKVHLVAHSVGGYLSVVLANRRPDLVESMCLMDPTPVWGLNLPGWSGKFPAPTFALQAGKFLLDNIANPDVIKLCLDQAYHNVEAVSADLVDNILQCVKNAENKALSTQAISSILWSEPANFGRRNSNRSSGQQHYHQDDKENDGLSTTKTKDFYENLKTVGCDVLLIFGKKDPWCKPCFAKKMLGKLAERRRRQKTPQQQQSPTVVARYVELENVGHCPNHEAPTSVGKALRNWMSVSNTNSRKGANRSSRTKQELQLVQGEEEVVKEPWADNIVMRELDQEDIPMDWSDHVATFLV